MYMYYASYVTSGGICKRIGLSIRLASVFGWRINNVNVSYYNIYNNHIYNDTVEITLYT